MSNQVDSALLAAVLGRIDMGIVLVDRQLRIVYWNGFMEIATGLRREQAIGSNILDLSPELPRRWLSKKLQAVFLLGNYAFTSWRERPHLLRMSHNRPITGGIDSMRQDCTFFPLRGSDGDVELVCLTIRDVTDTAIIEGRLEEALRDIEILSNQDALTGLCNRRRMEEQLEQEVARARRYDTPLAAILLDLDNFKRINDSFGHLCGDQVLREVSRLVCETVRTADICSRYGGEELALILPSTALKGALELAERLRLSIEAASISFQNQEIRVTTSAGVSQLSDTCRVPYDLLDQADQALYVAKQQGRNRVVPFHHTRAHHTQAHHTRTEQGE